jgi:hypothetical protein
MSTADCTPGTHPPPKPNSAGRYLEIFARRNNLRDYWVSIGNEVGVGLPDSDLEALRRGGAIPGAKYGRGGEGNSQVTRAQRLSCCGQKGAPHFTFTPVVSRKTSSTELTRHPPRTQSSARGMTTRRSPRIA